MRFHADPQGAAWAPETAVVSVGAPRRFVFRATRDPSVRYAYHVRSGDVVQMHADCQRAFQHALLPEKGAAPAPATDAGADSPESTEEALPAPRISLVFKKRLGGAA
jgi:hypothetical protein